MYYKFYSDNFIHPEAINKTIQIIICGLNDLGSLLKLCVFYLNIFNYFIKQINSF